MKKGFAKMFGRGESGTALIEFAVLLPVFLILVFAVIGFGYAYVIYEAEGRAVSSTGRAIQNDSYLNNTNSTYYTTEPGVLQTDADNIFGAPLALFNGTTGNSICAQAYAQNAVPANPSNYCSGNTWKIQTWWNLLRPLMRLKSKG